MPQVTLLPVSTITCRLHCSYIHQFTSLHLHIIQWAFPQCKASQPTTKATGTQGPTLSGAVQGQESVY